MSTLYSYINYIYLYICLSTIFFLFCFILVCLGFVSHMHDASFTDDAASKINYIIIIMIEWRKSTKIIYIIKYIYI